MHFNDVKRLTCSVVDLFSQKGLCVVKKNRDKNQPVDTYFVHRLHFFFLKKLFVKDNIRNRTTCDSINSCYLNKTSFISPQFCAL